MLCWTRVVFVLRCVVLVLLLVQFSRLAHWKRTYFFPKNYSLANLPNDLSRGPVLPNIQDFVKHVKSDLLHQLSVLNLIKELIPIGTLLSENLLQIVLNPSSANPTKWSNTLKQFVGKLPSNCLSVFDHFVKLAFKGLILSDNSLQSKLYTIRKLISTNKKFITV